MTSNEDGKTSSEPSSVFSSEQTRVMLRLTEGWRPALPSLTAPSAVTWGEEVFPVDRCIVRVVGRDLTVELDGIATSSLFLKRGGDFLRPLQIEYESGTRLQGRAFASRHQIAFDKSGSSLTLSSREWNAKVPEKQPVLWCGRLEGGFSVIPGNLVLRRHYRGSDGTPYFQHSSGHLKLEGTRPYAVLRTNAAGKEEHWWVIASEELPSRDDLHRDFLAFQFAIGQRLMLPVMTAVDASGEYCNADSVDLGEPALPATAAAPAVPIRFADRAWLPTFFNLLSRTAREDWGRRHLNLPLSAYVESTAQRGLHFRYALLGLSIVAFIDVLAKKNDNHRLLVNDAEAWKRWIDSQRAILASLATDGRIDELIQEIDNAQLRHATIAEDCRSVGLDLTDSAAKELGRLPRALRSFDPRFDQTPEELPSSHEQLSLLRQVLIGLVATAVEYEGAIDGREQIDTQDVAVAIPQARKNWGDKIPLVPEDVATIESAPEPPLVDWPEFGRSPFRDLASVKLVEDFCGRLASKTDGKVIARVNWIPTDQKDSARFQVVLQVAQHPSAQVQLFSFSVVSEFPDTLYVEDTTEDGMTGHVLTGSQAVPTFLAKIANSEATRKRVDRILSLADSLA